MLLWPVCLEHRAHRSFSAFWPARLFSEAFRFRDTKDLLRGNGGLADVKYLKTFLIENLGDLTFSEALEKSGLHINVAVAPYDGSQNARIMNAYTAPNLLVWSAVLASCAVPVLFPAVRLTSKTVMVSIRPTWPIPDGWMAA